MDNEVWERVSKKKNRYPLFCGLVSDDFDALQYDSNLQVSMARAFPDIQLQDAQNNYKEALGAMVS